MCLCFFFFFLKTFSNEHFRSQPPCVTSWNQSGGSGSTQLKFRKCAASVCSTRLLCLHWRKYASRYSPVSPKTWYFIKTWKYEGYNTKSMLILVFFLKVLHILMTFCPNFGLSSVSWVLREASNSSWSVWTMTPKSQNSSLLCSCSSVTARGT